ncbi:MAG: carbonic anhydrase [Coleofasciculaceae cyanobacterium SM2_1_6]|nr:carbonic anhydrase [Coleofasciculaceae cyanobacterium SM2_1_6]
MAMINGFLGRRDLFKVLGIGGLGLMTNTAAPAFADTSTVNKRVAPETALDRLLAGNQDCSSAASQQRPCPETALDRLLAGNLRFVSSKANHPHQSLKRIKSLAQAQHPYATILSCADSRVSGEIVFDEGLGDLFDIRIAGNIATPEVIGSIEYAVAHLHTPLLMVLGHERCGAVTAAVDGGELEGKIPTLVAAIAPAVERARGQAGDLLENAVVANIQYQIERLLELSSVIKAAVAAGELKIVGGRYDLDQGKVTLV